MGVQKIGVSAPGNKRDYSAVAETCLALTAEYDLLLRSSFSFPEQVLMDKFLYRFTKRIRAIEE